VACGRVDASETRAWVRRRLAAHQVRDAHTHGGHRVGLAGVAIGLALDSANRNLVNR
jgi:hypothetical protein